jgi:CheY-like chemotaxis protein
MGNEVRTAHDGVEGLATAAAYRPDVIVLDIGMPRMNGLEACRRIREQPWSQGIFIVALTGWGQDDDKRRSHEAGFDHHLIKPVEPAALEQLLESVAVRKAE